MKIKLVSICIVLSVLNIIFPFKMNAQSYSSLWKDLEHAQQKSLPKQVMELADVIMDKAGEENNAGQFFKAYLVKKNNINYLMPDSFQVNLKDMEQRAFTAIVPVDAAIWHFLAAAEYTDFYNWNFHSLSDEKEVVRTELPEDLSFWSRNELLLRMTEHISRVFDCQAELAAMSSRKYRPLVVQGKQSDWFDHSMLSLLGLESVNLLKSVTGYSRDSLCMEQIKDIYTTLISEAERLEQREGCLFHNLEYLKWRKDYDTSFVAHKAPAGLLGLSLDPYIDGLNRLMQEYKDLPVCAEVYLAKAELATNEDLLKQAVGLCDEAIRLYPKYCRIDAVRSLKESLVLPELRTFVRDFVYPGEPVRLGVSYRNLDKFSVYLLKNGKKVSDFSFELANSGDYQEQDTVVSFLAPEAGKYQLLLQTESERQGKDNNTKELQVSRLKVLVTQLQDGNTLVKVLDAKTGHPIENATVRFYTYRDELTDLQKTNASGSVLKPIEASSKIVAELDGDEVMVYGGYNGNNNYEGERSDMFLLTDRSIYRPGQLVYVKGISFQTEKEKAEVEVGKSVELELIDASGQVIATKEAVTNDFGSFTTQFALPDACMNGTFRLRTRYCAVNFKVESYKRPTFKVELSQPDIAYGLGDTVSVKLQAKSFAGAPMTGASVQYAVYRSAYFWGRASERNEMIASGKAVLDADGHYDIQVPLLEKEDSDEESPFLFTYYEVEALVVNLAGETQKEQLVLSVGKEPLEISTNLSQKICRDVPVSAIFRINTAMGKLIELDGHYALYQCPDGDKEKARCSQPVDKGSFTSGQEQVIENWKSLPSGAYLLVATADDGSHQGEMMHDIVLFSVSDKRPPVEEALWVYSENTSFDSTHPAVFYIGTSYQDVWLYKNVQHNNRVFLVDELTVLSDTVFRVEVPYEECYGDGITYNYSFVRNGILYQADIQLKRRIPEHKLQLKWNTFRDKMVPGQQEVWSLTVTDLQGNPVDAELLAEMYDASLDEIWESNPRFNWLYRPQLAYLYWNTNNFNSYYYAYFTPKVWKYTDWNFDYLYNDKYVREKPKGQILCKSASARATGAVNNVVFEEESIAYDSAELVEVQDVEVELRTDLKETAFFYPFLKTDSLGQVQISFTLPQSLTSWRFRGYAHTKDMYTGTLTDVCVASKEFMVTPNMPRFVRQGDQVNIAAVLDNLTEQKISGRAVMTLFDPVTEKVISKQQVKFSVDGKGSSSVDFDFKVDNRYDLLGCKIVAGNDTFSDGEQHLLPVLSNRVNLLETVSVPVRGKEKKSLSAEHLFNNHSKTAENCRITVELTGNPLWYVVQALPVLAEPEYKDAFSWASAYYALVLSEYLADKNPVIKNVLDKWKLSEKDSNPMVSALEKNQDLKNTLLKETPWILEAQDETAQMNRIALLFDKNNLNNLQITMLNRLKELQDPQGAWSWYPGMPGNMYVTLYVMTLQERLVMLMEQPLKGEAGIMQSNGWNYLDKKLNELYVREQKNHIHQYLPAVALDYLYLAALSERRDFDDLQPVVDYYLRKVPALLQGASMKDKAKAAVILNWTGNRKDAEDMMASLKEHLVKSEENGMYFAFMESPYSWGERQLPAQVQVMEAFNRVAHDSQVVEEMKVWLLKQKQTNAWNTSVATADAVYAMLMSGSKLTADKGNFQVSMGNKTVSSLDSKIEGLGYVRKTFDSKDVLDARKIQVSKEDAGTAWGAVYAQFSEQLDAVNEQAEGIRVSKELFLKEAVDGQEKLTQITPDMKLRRGDQIVVRLHLTLDRSMEFVEVKDMRAACMEPAQQLSGYLWQHGLGYYVDQKDVATYYFFDNLGKGAYILDSTYKIDRTGKYECGVATVQSAYAPEFSAHSASVQIVVQ